MQSEPPHSLRSVRLHAIYTPIAIPGVVPERPPPTATARALTVAAIVELFVAEIVIAPASGAAPVAVIVPPSILAFVFPPILLTAVAPPPAKARLFSRLRETE